MFTWSCGLLPHDTLLKIHDDLGNEGQTTKLYLDTRSFVTIGIGTMLPTAESAKLVRFTHEDTGKPATDQEKMNAWQTVQNISPQKTDQAFAAKHFAKMTKIRINEEEAARLRDVKLDEFYHDLVRSYPGFDSMPEPAKIALFDMIYNIGPGLPRKFHLFDQAVRARDWAKAAASCNRRGIPPDRNQRTRLLFLSCLSDASPALPPVAAPRTNTRPSAKPAAPVDRTPYHRRLPKPLRVTRAAVIKRGDRGADVTLVQNAINRLIAGQAPLLSLDGKFGLVTEAAVRRIQHHASLHADGVVGGHTKRVLDLV